MGSGSLEAKDCRKPGGVKGTADSEAPPTVYGRTVAPPRWFAWRETALAARLSHRRTVALLISGRPAFVTMV